MMLAPSVPCSRSFAAVDRGVEELAAGAGQLGHAEDGAEVLGAEGRLVAVDEVEPGEQGALGRAAELPRRPGAGRAASATAASQPGYQPGGRERAASAARSAARKASFCGPVGAEDDDLAAMQLKPLLCSRWVATCSAWNRRSACDQRPGTTMTGATPPSSLVIGLSSRGVPAAFAARPSSPVPQTMASWVASLPVMCTAATPGCWARRPPTRRRR